MKAASSVVGMPPADLPLGKTQWALGSTALNVNGSAAVAEKSRTAVGLKALGARLVLSQPLGAPSVPMALLISKSKVPPPLMTTLISFGAMEFVRITWSLVFNVWKDRLLDRRTGCCQFAYR